MKGFLPCVAREQYEKERSEASSIHHSGNCMEAPAEQSFQWQSSMWARVKKRKSSFLTTYNYLDVIWASITNFCYFSKRQIYSIQAHSVCGELLISVLRVLTVCVIFCTPQLTKIFRIQSSKQFFTQRRHMSKSIISHTKHLGNTVIACFCLGDITLI